MMRLLTERQISRIDRNFPLAEMVNDCGRLRNDEEAIVLMLRMMLAFGHLEGLLRSSPIGRHRFELSVPGGRIDLALFHVDGGVSLIEAKAENQSMRSVAAGIGQLCYYAAQLPTVLPSKPVYVNRFLAAPIHAPEALPLVRACAIAGVKFVPLPTFAQFRAVLEEEAAKMA